MIMYDFKFYTPFTRQIAIEGYSSCLEYLYVNFLTGIMFVICKFNVLSYTYRSR